VFNLFNFFKQELAIDLGTANTLIMVDDKVVVDEPSIIARDRQTGKTVAVGRQAQQMHGKTHENIKTIRPLKDGVIADFNMYSDLIRIGGYVVFDDYNDCLYSPDVKKVVDSLIPSLSDYEIIGTFKNDLQAYPSELEEGNCFVIKKLK
jgi:rod shape-determining protein MreB